MSLGERDGKKLLGKFIRKNDPIRELINIQSFNLKEISTHPSAIQDNSNSNIVHTKLHDPEDIKAAIHKPEFVTREYFPEGGKRPVLVPLDFTKDWEAMKRRTIKRNTQFDEDDDDLFFNDEDLITEANLKKEEEAKKNHEKGKDKEEAEQEAKPQEEKAAIKEAQDQNKEQAPLDDEKEDEQKEPLQEEKEAILSINKEKEALDTIAKSMPSDDKNPLGADLHPQKEEQPLEPAALEETNNAEDSTEADQKGYQDGYQRGMEEALSEVQKDYDDKAKTIASMMSDLEGLKKDILHNAQENFAKIATSMMEAILQKEYKINPESFASFIERAIEEGVEDDDFKIQVHPDQIEQLASFFKGDLASHIEPNDSITQSDFKIVSKHKVIDGKIKKLIEDMLEQADVNLFSKDEAS